MFEIVEESRPLTVALIGIGSGGSDFLRGVREAAPAAGARFFEIDGNDASWLEGTTELGRDATLSIESRSQLIEAVRGADMVLIAADAECSRSRDRIVAAARIARREAAMVVGVMSTPSLPATRGVHGGTPADALSGNGLSVVGVPRPGLISSALREVFTCVVRGLVLPLLVPCDFQDVRCLLHEGRRCFIGWGSASGPSRTRDATLAAIEHPLLGMAALREARQVLIAVRGQRSGVDEAVVRGVVTTIQGAVGREPWLVVHAHADDSLTDALHVSILAVGR